MSIVSKEQLEKTVKITRSGATVKSDDVAKIFDKQHKNVLKQIRSLINDLSIIEENQSATNIANQIKEYFRDSTYIDSKGRNYPRFELTRKGFDLLVMGFTGSKALKYKIWFIDEFYRKDNIIAQDKALAKEHLKDDMFVELRALGKDIRKLFTKTIQEYELPQRVSEGKDATRFVSLRSINYTKLVYKKLGLEIPKGADPRDVFSPAQITQIAILEDKITDMIVANSLNKIHYKDSYLSIKKIILDRTSELRSDPRAMALRNT